MQNSFTVSPVLQEINLKRGDVYQGEITVANPANASSDLDFKVSLSPYSVTDGSTPDFQTMSDWSRIVEWTKLDTESGTLKPNETKKIKFTIEVPQDAPSGGQYLMVGVSTEVNDSGATKSIYEMASLVLARIEGETVHNGTIKENTVPSFIASGTPVTKFIATNAGNVHEKATVKITIKNTLSGEQIALTDDTDNTYDVTIMPESERVVERELKDLPILGIFEVHQDVNYLGNSYEASSTMIICPVWFMVLVLGIIISIIGMICYGVHLKRKKMEKTIAI